MKRKRMWLMVLVLVIVGGALFAASSWTSSTNIRPPLPTVRVGSVMVEVKQSTFCWAEDSGGLCEDHGLPKASDLQLVSVEPGAEIDITFHEEPLRHTFYQVVDEKIVPTSLKVPDEPGVYVFEAGGDWKQGDSHYVFGVEVEE